MFLDALHEVKNSSNSTGNGIVSEVELALSKSR
jgi:hypothetical protein